MAKREHPRARPKDKSRRSGKVPRACAHRLSGGKRADLLSGKAFTINALCQ
jgi:hypothetical protein